MTKNRIFASFLAVSLALVGASVSASASAAPLVTATNSVVLSSEAMIERTETDAAGKERTVLKQPKDVIIVPGDKVVFTLRYSNNGAEAASGFRATNPMPGPVQFLTAAEEWAEVSVDGGKSWGKLSELKVAVKGVEGAADTIRIATPEDVTHVRWVFANAIAPGGRGQLSYRGQIK
jgi:hypothetical protein